MEEKLSRLFEKEERKNGDDWSRNNLWEWKHDGDSSQGNYKSYPSSREMDSRGGAIHRENNQ